MDSPGGPGDDGGMTDAGALAAARGAVDRAARRLAEAAIPTEALAERVPPRRMLGIIARPATMRRLGPVWRLGVLLVSPSGQLLATGGVTLADHRVRPGHQALSAQARQELRRSALRAGFEDGAAVDFDATPIPLDDVDALAAGIGPVRLSDDVLGVRWAATVDTAVPIERYLEERVDLLLEFSRD